MTATTVGTSEGLRLTASVMVTMITGAFAAFSWIGTVAIKMTKALTIVTLHRFLNRQRNSK